MTSSRWGHDFGYELWIHLGNVKWRKDGEQIGDKVPLDDLNTNVINEGFEGHLVPVVRFAIQRGAIDIYIPCSMPA